MASRRRLAVYLRVIAMMTTIGVTTFTAQQSERGSSSRMNTPQLPPSIQRPSDAADVFAIWPGNGVPPGAERWDRQEQAMAPPAGMGSTLMVRNVVVPTLTMFAPNNGGNGTAIIVAPGGAFQFLMMDHEGYDVARWIAQQGVTAFVLRYRVARTPDVDAEMPAFLTNLFEVLPPVAPRRTRLLVPPPPSRRGVGPRKTAARRFASSASVPLNFASTPNVWASWDSRPAGASL